jgi:hypothetical protein
MSEIAPPSIQRDIKNGDRIRIQQGQRAIPDLLGHSGTVVEVFRMPLSSCMVRIDNDPENQREWFLYRDEIALGTE